jgi:BR-signaling kinase
MHNDAVDMLNEAAALEEKKQRGGKGSWEKDIQQK